MNNWSFLVCFMVLFCSQVFQIGFNSNLGAFCALWVSIWRDFAWGLLFFWAQRFQRLILFVELNQGNIIKSEALTSTQTINCLMIICTFGSEKERWWISTFKCALSVVASEHFAFSSICHAAHDCCKNRIHVFDQWLVEGRWF